MKTEARFIQFPLFLMQELLIDKQKTLDKILDFGIYNYSKKLNYLMYAVARQICYENYRGHLSMEIRKLLNVHDFEYFGKDEDYSGFIGFKKNSSNFEPLEEIEEINKAFESSKHLKELSIEFYKVHLAINFLKITHPDKSRIIENAKEIEKLIPKNEPMPMVNVSSLFEFRDKEKSKYELIQFAAFIAVKSIIGGKRQCTKTNKKHIVSRMLGFSSHLHLPQEPKQIIKELLNKYSIRYHIDKLLIDLELNWGVITYSNNIRGLYVAINDKITIEKLALEAETRKRKNKIEDLKSRKRDAKEKALARLGLNKYNERNRAA